MLLSLSFKYWLLVFIGVMGVLQGAAARNHLRGLRFFRYGTASYVFAALAIGFPLFIFFNWNSLFATGVIEGAEQAGLFAVATLAAIFCTLLISSAIRSASFKRQAFHPHKLRALQQGAKANGRR